MQTYFALLATLLVLLASGVVLLVVYLRYDVPVGVFFYLAPATGAAFVLSLIIGHFLAEPLDTLVKTATAMRGRLGAVIQPDGRLYEADELAVCYNDLVQTVHSQQTDLAAKSKRQSQFISDVAHELRTPLTAISGTAEMLLDPDMPPEMHNHFVGTIMSESARLSRLTNDLLTLQRLESASTPFELSRVNLTTVAHGVIDMLEPILRERGANVEVVGEAPDVLGNADKLRQVLSNLVENASRFIEPGGHIRVELFGLPGKSVIAVKDDGSGFGDIDPALLFDRFYRGDPSRNRNTGGTGLGLAIVKSITEAHDGTVEAFNLPDRGACFMVELPSIV